VLVYHYRWRRFLIQNYHCCNFLPTAYTKTSALHKTRQTFHCFSFLHLQRIPKRLPCTHHVKHFTAVIVYNHSVFQNVCPAQTAASVSHKMSNHSFRVTQNATPQLPCHTAASVPHKMSHCSFRVTQNVTQNVTPQLPCLTAASVSHKLSHKMSHRSFRVTQNSHCSFRVTQNVTQNVCPAQTAASVSHNKGKRHTPSVAPLHYDATPFGLARTIHI